MAKAPKASKKDSKKPTTSRLSKQITTGKAIATKTETEDPCSSQISVIVPGPCCPCFGLETGVWGIMWYNAAGECVCLPGPTGPGVDKILRCDGNGPYWGNP